MNDLYHAFCRLMQIALAFEGESLDFKYKLSDSDWSKIHSECLRQLMVAVVYRAVCRLPKEQRPPLDLMFQWASEAETVKGQNEIINAEAARLTQLFEAEGRKSAVLKGAANARLYPDAFMRQAGDIDLWVEGGRKSVFALLKKMNFELDEKDKNTYHHIHVLHAGKASVELHFRPSSGTFNPLANVRLQRYLNREILNTERVPEGFFVPSIKFALVMQLAHIERHFVSGGIGFKQFLDYFILLQYSTAEDRREVTSKISEFGLKRVARAVMWVLGEVLGLDAEKMLVAPDERLGRKMLEVIYEGGNFGFYRADIEDMRKMNFFVRWLKNRWRCIRLFPFMPMEVLWCQIDYWKNLLNTIPFRIKHRRLSIWDLYN